MIREVDALLSEAQRAKLTERRTEPRHPFVRPVVITVGRDPGTQAFSKDLSKQGIGVVTDQEYPERTIAVLTIHSTTSHPVHLKCELRWSDPFGKGWYLTGWKFIGTAAPPMAG